MVKSSLRVKYKDQITKLNESERKAQSLGISQKLESFLKGQNGLWTLYCPLSDEPNLLSLLDSCSHIEWAFPRVESQTEMTFRKVESRDQMVTTSWGLEEPHPSTSQVIPTGKITGCIVPGLAFDQDGLRLGRGGGYYDRFLGQYSGLRIGVTFNEGLAKEPLPKEGHDELMNIIVSPRNWIEVNVKKEVKNGI